MPAKLTLSNRAEVEREMITCLYRILNATEPQVPVTKCLVGECKEVIDRLLEEAVLSAYFGKWALIFECIDWTNPRRSTGPRCGLKLLQFLGHLGDALREGGDASISRSTAIELLMEFQEDDDLYARYGFDNEDQWWIETTPEGEKVIGCPVKLGLPEPPLTRLYGVPQELFDHVLGIWRLP